MHKTLREEGGRSGQGCGGRGGRGSGGGRDPGSDGQRAPWDSTTKSNTSGVNMIDGVWKMGCEICGWNETHTTKFHEEQQQLVATFKVPPHHPLWLLLGNLTLLPQLPQEC